MSKQDLPVAFINVPYAIRYERVYLALIAGISAYGLTPTAAVRDPSSRFQLERIYELIASSQYSFHDLSFVSLDRRSPQTPRLNMAFELGLAVAVSRSAGANHQWFVFDTVPYRLDKALSDLGGIRPRIHDRTPESVLRALMNVLGRLTDRPTLSDLLKVYGEVEKSARRIKRGYSLDLFDTKPFADLIFAASEAAQLYVPSLA
ncbi:MAG: hypothetical protein JO093_05580 [Acidobacteria bacterium]|nr:hypothetical protein [Acidobacteriota bacterium]MBV9068250.1 hypothetical protein [Acidobacteriota bacterium]MBV9185068.1 hypothetical protein [Acidobacteriota bacterium]